MIAFVKHIPVSVNPQSEGRLTIFEQALALIANEASGSYVTFPWGGIEASISQEETANAAYQHHQAKMSRALGGELHARVTKSYGGKTTR